MTKDLKYGVGGMESRKFESRRPGFRRYMEYVDGLQLSCEDLLGNVSAYVGHMTLNRVLTIYELYKRVLGLAGHIADVGVYRGASSLQFAKMVKIFEPEALTMVHGFDWFQGRVVGDKDSGLVPDGGCVSDYDDVLELVRLQDLDSVLQIHKLDLRSGLDAFFDRFPHLRFKLAMLDAGQYDVMRACIPAFYARLVPGGVMVFDQYAHEYAPGETLALTECLPGAVVRSIPNSWMPNAYVIKGAT